MALSQHLQQKMLQKLSPQQIQLMKLLQVPTAQLEERIKEELEENPALEQTEEGHEDEFEMKDEFSSEGEEFEPDGSEEDYENIDISEYVSDSDDEPGDYKYRDDQYGEPEEEKVTPHKVETSFNELMIQQLGLLKLNEHQNKIAEQIIGSLDDDGYLRREPIAIVDDLAFRQNIETTENEVTDIIRLIQDFDPAGVAAADLRECLLIQLKRKLSQGEEVQTAIKVIDHYFDEFTKKHYEKIQKGLGLTELQLRHIIKQVVRLNPKPGVLAGDSNKGENYIIPDFFIVNNNGKLELSLNGLNAPELRVSEGYREMLTDYEKGAKKDKRQKEAVMFIKQKLDAAKWFIDAIKQRQNTLLNTMEAILNYQYNFFLQGDETELKPMILKDIAEKTGLDISTVSRVANSKFVQTEFGTYRLKFFFSESLQTESGEEVSTREVKRILSDIINDEDKQNPHSDEKLTDMLQEKGYNIARRTVAKYREQLDLARWHDSEKYYNMNDSSAERINITDENEISFSWWLQWSARFFSYLLHPVFLPVYVAVYFTLLHPLLFVGFSYQERLKTIIIVFLNTGIFPLVTVLLLRALGFVSSIQLHTQKDRIIPYIASGIFYFWAYTVFKGQTEYPSILRVFMLGIFLASSAALLANIYYKVSMHTIGMGGVVGILLILFFQNNLLPGWPLAAAFLLSGVIGSARLILKSHQPFDIYSGFIIGVLMQLVANYFAG